METYTITLANGSKLQGYKNLDYAGHDAYGKETYKGSDVFLVKDIYFTEDLKEIIRD
jgi:hypothetical protein